MTYWLKLDFLTRKHDLNQLFRELSIDLTNNRLKKASESEDMFLIQAINSIEEIDDATGKMVERLREWYAIHFPELDAIKNQERYVELVADIGGQRFHYQLRRIRF